MQHTLIYRNSTLTCQQTGHGEKVLLLFHGFGQHHRAFVALTDTLGAHYTMYAFDLFFHGTSQWNEGEEPLEKTMWQEIMQNFLSQHSIRQFSVLGFSLGGKFALATLELFPTQVTKILLLAPDGIKTSGWYRVATYPILLRQFFKSMIMKPGRLHAITTVLHSLKLVDNGLLRFAESQMDTPEKRKRVYYSWVVFRHLHFDLRAIAILIRQHGIGLTIITGRHDKIITTQNMQRLVRHVQHYQLEELDTGHNGVIAGSIPVLAKAVSP